MVATAGERRRDAPGDAPDEARREGRAEGPPRPPGGGQDRPPSEVPGTAAGEAAPGGAVEPARQTVRLGDEAPTGRLLRVFLGERDRVGGVPAYRAVVEAARAMGLAGATVLHGSIGYGANSVIHRPELWRLSGDLPIVIEVVDSDARVSALIARLESMLEGGGLITVENVRVLRYQGGGD